jgi:hypothetical protein
MVRSRGAAALGAVGIVVAGAAVAPLGAAADDGARAAQACVAAKNVEFINDDSGSMASFDPGKNRAEAIKLLLSKAANRGGTTFGAVEFGDEAGVLFGPGLITPQNVGFANSIVDQRTQNDGARPVGSGGGTNYNAAFAVATQHNPGANARVFLTDGGHNEGEYQNGHRGGPPTYVIGFGSSTVGEAGTRLQQIATETNGRYFPQTDSSSLTGVIEDIDAKLSCARRTRTFTDQFQRTGQSRPHRLGIGSGIRSVEFTVLWRNATDVFDISRIRVFAGRRLVGFARARRLKVTRRRGKTFTTVRVRGNAIRRGRKLRFSVKAKRLTLGATQVRTTVAQSRRR